jgi:[ribosomal protein S5]-alanine N-acetyltransferase
VDFILRPWHIEDITSIAKYANNKKIADNLRDAYPFPYTLEDALVFISGFSQEDSSYVCRAIEVNGEAAGSIGVFQKDDVYAKSAEMGYWLAEPYWGRGIMTACIRQAAALAFAKLNIVRIFAEPYAYNTGSRRALEKAGFTQEGILKKSIYKNGKIHDSCIYAMVK